MPDFSKMRLGKLPPVFRPTDLKLAKYLPASLPAPPDEVDYSYGVNRWGELLNDDLGCCTISGAGHTVQSWRLSLIGGGFLTIPDPDILSKYEAWCGYNPNDSSTDQGGVESDVLRDWRKSGFTVNGIGHNLKAFTNVDPQNFDHVKQTINLFGGIYTGIALPLSAQNQEIWSVGDAPGSWGGHCTWIVRYDTLGLTCVTWGVLQRMTWKFWLDYVDEAWCLMSDTDFNNPNGVLYDALLADLAVVTA